MAYLLMFNTLRYGSFGEVFSGHSFRSFISNFRLHSVE